MKINQSNTTLKLVLSAVMIGIGTVLSMFKFNGIWIYGGGVTFCAMLPLVIISFIYGTKWGLFTSFVFALLQMVLGFNNVLYGTNLGMMIIIALLDYIIAYTVVGLSAIFKNKFGNSTVEIAVGTAFALALRFVSHFISGWFIWDALWPNEMGMTSAVYSLFYNGSYMLPEIIITALVAVILDRVLHFTSDQTE